MPDDSVAHPRMHERVHCVCVSPMLGGTGEAREVDGGELGNT